MKSGEKYIYYNARIKRWVVSVYNSGYTEYGGSYEDLSDAVKARDEKIKSLKERIPPEELKYEDWLETLPARLKAAKEKWETQHYTIEGIDWREIEGLGEVKDSVIAQKYGVDTETVQRARMKLGIARIKNPTDPLTVIK